MGLTVQLLASVSLNRERCKVPGSPWVRQCRFWLFFSSPLVAMTLAACTQWVPNVSDQHSWLMIILNPRTFCWGFKIIRDHAYPYLNPFLFERGRHFYYKKNDCPWIILKFSLSFLPQWALLSAGLTYNLRCRPLLSRLTLRLYRPSVKDQPRWLRRILK